MTSEEKNEYSENNRKREESTLDYKFMDEFKSKENRLYKERRSIRDETDTWTYIASEGDREVLDVCQMEENSGKCWKQI